VSGRGMHTFFSLLHGKKKRETQKETSLPMLGSLRPLRQACSSQTLSTEKVHLQELGVLPKQICDAEMKQSVRREELWCEDGSLDKITC
jgi:hypothetical protein